MVMLLKGYIRCEGIRLRFLWRFIKNGIITSICCILITIIIDSWFWNKWNNIIWPEYHGLFKIYKSYAFSTDFYKLLPKLLLVNLILMIFSFIKINPLLFVYELIQRNTNSNKKDIDINTNNEYSHLGICRLLLIFFDYESILLWIICLIFIFLNSFLANKEIRFIFFVIPPCTLLSTIGCIRLLTCWGLKGIHTNNYSLNYYCKYIYNKQSQSYFIWINPNHNTKLQLIIKIISSIDIKRDLHYKNIWKKLLQIKQIKLYLFIFYTKLIKSKSKSNSNLNIKSDIIPLLVTISIILSFIIAFCGVYEASYNYPGGVAITQFPFIVKQNILNITQIGINDIYWNYHKYDDNDQYNEFEDGNNEYYNYYDNDYDDRDYYDYYNTNTNTNTNTNNKNNDDDYQDYNNNNNNEMDRNQRDRDRDYTYNYNDRKKRNYRRGDRNNHHYSDYGAYTQSKPTKKQSKQHINNNKKQQRTNSNNNKSASASASASSHSSDSNYNKYDKYDNNNIYEKINCVHIGNKAASTGVTNFVTPTYYSEFKFDKTQNLSKTDYARRFDPCNIYSVLYNKICINNNDDDENVDNDNDKHIKWNDDIYDDEYIFNDNDNVDYLNENNTNNTNCPAKIKNQLTTRGYDYLITEYREIPGYQLMPHGVIYAKSEGSSIFNGIKSLVFNLKFNQDDFLAPTLYVLKRQ